MHIRTPDNEFYHVLDPGRLEIRRSRTRCPNTFTRHSLITIDSNRKLSSLSRGKMSAITTGNTIWYVYIFSASLCTHCKRIQRLVAVTLTFSITFCTSTTTAYCFVAGTSETAGKLSAAWQLGKCLSSWRSQYRQLTSSPELSSGLQPGPQSRCFILTV